MAHLTRTTVSIADVKAVWDSMENPTPQSVANALTQVGMSINRTTVKRWFDRGWKYKASLWEDNRSSEVVRLVDSVALPISFGDPKVRVSHLIAALERAKNGEDGFTEFEKKLTALAKAIVGLSDSQLLAEAIRTVFHYNLLGMKAAMAAEENFVTHPEQMANAGKAYAFSVATATNTLRVANMPSADEVLPPPADGAAAKPVAACPAIVIDHLGEALRSWRAPPSE